MILWGETVSHQKTIVRPKARSRSLKYCEYCLFIAEIYLTLADMEENKDAVCLICRSDGDLVDAHSCKNSYRHLCHIECMQGWLNHTNRIVCPLCSQNFGLGFLKELSVGQPAEFRLKCMSSICSMGDIKLLREYIADEQCWENLYTDILELASKNDSLDVVKLFVDHDINIHAMNRALIVASEHGNLEIVKYLVDNGADVHAENDRPVKFASRNGHLQVFKFLIHMGVDKSYALMIASRHGHIEIIRSLLRSGVNIRARNDGAFLWAAYGGHIEAVKFLARNGANIHAQNDYALLNASHNGHLDVVKFLIRNGANVYAWDNGPLRWAAHNMHTSVVDYLKKAIKDNFMLANKIFLLALNDD